MPINGDFKNQFFIFEQHISQTMTLDGIVSKSSNYIIPSMAIYWDFKIQFFIFEHKKVYYFPISIRSTCTIFS